MGDFKTQVNGRTKDLKALFKKAVKVVGPPCKKGATVVGSGCKKGWAKVRHHLIKKWWCQQPSFSLSLSASMNAWIFPSNQKMLGFLHFNCFTIKLIWFDLFLCGHVFEDCVVDYPLYVIRLALSPLSFLSHFLRALPEFSWDFHVALKSTNYVMSGNGEL